MKVIYISEGPPYLGTLGAFEEVRGYGEVERSVGTA